MLIREKIKVGKQSVLTVTLAKTILKQKHLESMGKEMFLQEAHYLIMHQAIQNFLNGKMEMPGTKTGTDLL